MTKEGVKCMKAKRIVIYVLCVLMFAVLFYVAYEIYKEKSIVPELEAEKRIDEFYETNIGDYMTVFDESARFGDYTVTLERGYYNDITGVMAAIFDVQCDAMSEKNYQEIWNSFRQEYYLYLDTDVMEEELSSSDLHVSYKDDSIKVAILLDGDRNNNKNAIYIAQRNNTDKSKTEFTINDEGEYVLYEVNYGNMYVTPFGAFIKGLAYDDIESLEIYMKDGSLVEAVSGSGSDGDKMFLLFERAINVDEVDYVIFNSVKYGKNVLNQSTN